MGGSFSYYIPGNNKNKTYIVQLKLGGYPSNNYGLITSLTYDLFSKHSHNVNFQIYEETLTGGSVTVKAGAVGAEQTIETYSDLTKEDLDITSKITTGWNNVQFIANKNMRIEADIYIQIFIESK
jgi:hypothetical protein